MEALLSSSSSSSVSTPSTSATASSAPLAAVDAGGLTSPQLVGSGMREEQVTNAVRFLSHPSVRSAGLPKKRQFLLQKGLSEAEIDEAFRRTTSMTAANDYYQGFSSAGGASSSGSDSPAILDSRAVQSFPSSLPPQGSPQMGYYGPHHHPPPGVAGAAPAPYGYGTAGYFYPPYPPIPPAGGWSWQLLRGWLLPVLVSVGFAGVVAQIWTSYIDWRTYRNAEKLTNVRKALPHSPAFVESAKGDSAPQDVEAFVESVAGERGYDTKGRAERLSAASEQSALSQEFRTLKREVTDIMQEQTEQLKTISGLIRDMVQFQTQQRSAVRASALTVGETQQTTAAWIGDAGCSSSSNSKSLRKDGMSALAKPLHGPGSRTFGVDSFSTATASMTLLHDTKDDATSNAFMDTLPSGIKTADAAILEQRQKSEILSLVQRIVLEYSSDDKTTDVTKPLATLLLMLKNLLQSPFAEKYRKVNSLTPRLSERFGNAFGSTFTLLSYLGFQRQGSIYVFGGSDLSILELAYSVIEKVYKGAVASGRSVEQTLTYHLPSLMPSPAFAEEDDGRQPSRSDNPLAFHFSEVVDDGQRTSVCKAESVLTAYCKERDTSLFDESTGAHLSLASGRTTASASSDQEASRAGEEDVSSLLPLPA